MGLNCAKREKTIVLSDATSLAKDDILEMMNPPEFGSKWPNEPGAPGEFPCFHWRASPEDSTENHTACMEHIRRNVRLPPVYSTADAQPKHVLLSVDFRGIDGSRRTSGTADVVIAENANVANDAVRNSIEVLMELKKPRNIEEKDCNLQAVCKHFAASFLSRQKGAVSVLTDLNHAWVFCWFALHKDAPGVCLYKLKLEPSDKGAGLAKCLLESLHDGLHRGTLPSALADRLSFEEVTDELLRHHDCKRARTAFNGSGASSTPLPDQNSSGPKDQPPPSNQSGSNFGAQHIGEKSHGTSLANATSAPLLFVLPSQRDVANEIELLDMVDEDEQCEIVRSFAAKHMAPFTTGWS